MSIDIIVLSLLVSSFLYFINNDERELKEEDEYVREEVELEE